MRDRFSRGSHRELIAHAGLDQAKHGRVVDRSPLFIELISTIFWPTCAAAPSAHSSSPSATGRDPRQTARHQKTFLIRQSRA